MVNGKVLHPMVGHGGMSWVGESNQSVGRDGHRMIVEFPVYTVSKVSYVSDVSDEPPLCRGCRGFG